MFLFWFQSLRHQARRWPFLILLVMAVLVFPLFLWVFLDLQTLPEKPPTLLFFGKSIPDQWLLEAVQEGLAPSPPHPLWQGAEILSQLRLLWAMILWPTCWVLLLAWVAFSTSQSLASWLHPEVVGWLFSVPLSRTQWAVSLFLSSLALGLTLGFCFLLSTTLFLYGLTGILFLAPFLGLLPLALALALMASLGFLFACSSASSPSAIALMVLLLILFLVSYLFVPWFFHQIIEPFRSANVTFVYNIFSWLWPPFASLALVARKSLFLLPSLTSLLHGLICFLLSSLWAWRLLLRRPL